MAVWDYRFLLHTADVAAMCLAPRDKKKAHILVVNFSPSINFKQMLAKRKTNSHYSFFPSSSSCSDENTFFIKMSDAVLLYYKGRF